MQLSVLLGANTKNNIEVLQGVIKQWSRQKTKRKTDRRGGGRQFCTAPITENIDYDALQTKRESRTLPLKQTEKLKI